MKFTYCLIACLFISNAALAQDEWQDAFAISELTPKYKIGGLIRFNDPSFFYADQGKLVTRHGRYKRHRTFLFPQWKMSEYPYRLRVHLRKRDNLDMRAGIIFGAKTPYEFEIGGDETHGALVAYVHPDRLAIHDRRSEGTQVWNDAETRLSDSWDEGEFATLELRFSEGGAHGRVSASVYSDVTASLRDLDIDLGKPDELTDAPHIRGKGYFGVSVDGPGEVDILAIQLIPGDNDPIKEGLTAYTRACEWCVIKENARDSMNITFALREAGLTSYSLMTDGEWGEPVLMRRTASSRPRGMTIYTHTLTWKGERPERYRLMQGEETIFEGRVPPFSDDWSDGRDIVGIGVGGNEVWRYKQQNQRNWFDHILTQTWWQGEAEAFGPLSNNLGDNGTEFIHYQGVNNGWPDFVFGGDDYPGYPDNPILTLGEIDYQQRLWDALGVSDGLRELHGNVPSAFKGGDHEFANSDQLQPGGHRGEAYPAYIKNAYKAVSLEGHEPIHPEEVSFISKPMPGWIEVFHMVTRYNQTIAINTAMFPMFVMRTPEQSPSGLFVMEKLEEWARTSPAPFKLVHQDHPLGDIRDVSAKESYRLYPWERGAMIRLIAETGLIYAMGDEHNLRVTRYTDFSNAHPPDERLAPLSDMNIYEIGISNLSGEWFRHVREGVPSTDGFEYEVLYQSVPKTEKIVHGYQVRNGYVVFRFKKDERELTAEIWQRNGEDKGFRAKDPRSESPNYSHSFKPKDIFWRTSYLPDVNAELANARYRVESMEGEPLFANRAGADGWIRSQPCPPLQPGSKVRLIVESRDAVELITVAGSDG